MIIQIRECLDKLISFKDKHLIKVVTGIRRCGKSTLLKIYQEWLEKQGVSDNQIISINFEDMDYEELTVRDEKTLERELRPLKAIHDHSPKVLLTLDEDPEAQYDGIRRINARDCLLGLTD